MADVSIIISTNAKEASSEIGGLSASIAKSAAKANQMAKAFDFLDKSFNKGKIDAGQYSSAIVKLNKEEARLYSTLGKTTSAVNKQAVALNNSAAVASKASVAAKVLADRQRMSGKSTNKFGMISQQVGYQVGDFAVQVQSGTNALVAFGQQGTQLAGLIPGLGGAIVGIGLAIGTALAKVALESKGLTIDFKAVKKSFGDALAPMKPLIDAVGSAFSSLGGVVKSVGKTIADNISRLVAYGIAFAAIIGVKLVAAFILSGKAANTFFLLIKRGLISTGIGVFVVALGEIILRMQNMIVNAGSLASAWGAVKDVFFALWEYAGAQVDVYIARLKRVGPMMKNFIYATVSSLLMGVETLINKAIGGLNTMLGKVGLDTIGSVDLSSGFTDQVTKAQIALGQADAEVNRLKGTADSAFDGMLDSLNVVLGLAEGAKTSLDTSSWLVPETKDDAKGKSKSEDPIAKLQREIKLNKELLGVSREKAIVLTQVRGIQKELADEGKTYDEAKLTALVKYNEELKKQRADQLALQDTITSSMETGFMAMIDGTKSVKDAFKEMAAAIIKELLYIMVVKKAVSAVTGFFGFADGGAFSGGSEIKAYADGGVVGGPTTFPMSGGKTGLMGEAGPEAIMPLKRGANGKLGVQMEGGGGDTINVVQNFSFQANGDDSVKKIIAQAAPQIAQMTKSSLLNDRRRGGATKAAFG